MSYYARQLLDLKPISFDIEVAMLAAAIDALSDCALTCIGDTDADLGEPVVAEMVACIRLCTDCADVCSTAARITSRQFSYDPAVLRPLLEACAASCRTSGEECERHALRHEHCRICAEACRRGEQACRELLDAMK